MFIVVISISFVTIQGKWNVVLLKTASYYYMVKDNLVQDKSANTSNIVNAEVTKKFNKKLNINKRNVNILGLGDSLTKGVGSTKNKGYLQLFNDYLEDEGIDTHLKTVVKRGRVSKGLLNSVNDPDNKSLIEEADFIFITVGGNDIVSTIKEKGLTATLDDIMENKRGFSENLKNSIEKINDINKDVEIVFIGLYNPFLTWLNYQPETFKALTLWNKEYILLDNNYPNVHYIAVDDLFSEDSKGILYKDKFHPNDLGYQLITERIKDNFILYDGSM